MPSFASTLSRRHFIALAAAAAASAACSTAPRVRKPGANDKISLAFVGAGGRALANRKGLAANPRVRIAAFADVDDRRAAQTYKECPGVPTFRDFRRMLDKLGGEIDGVVVSTPDHTHHAVAMRCMALGKHVYLEKPLAHSIAEVRDLRAAEKRFGVVCQMGNQGHSGIGLALLDAWVKAGVLGEIRETRGWCSSILSNPDACPPAEPVPPEVDWDLWLGPAPFVAYSSRFLPASWRGWNRFGTGSLGDWFCHNADAAYTVLGLDCPSRVQIDTTEPNRWSYQPGARITYTFPRANGRGEVKLTWYQGKAYPPERPPEIPRGTQMGGVAGGTLLVGSKASVVMTNHAGSPRITDPKLHRELAPSLPRIEGKLSSHYDNWIRAILGEETARSHFDYASRITEAMHYGNIAMALRADLEIDPVRRVVTNHPGAAALMQGPEPRAGWKL